jgi:tryptophan halogenase
MSKKYHYVVVGGGTAGVISATYLKEYWGDAVDVTLVYDHNKPSIGVGESLTPTIYNYLNYVGITTEELIQNVNASIKLGLKFKNWLNDGGHFWNSFQQYDYGMNSLISAYEIVNDCYDTDVGYSSHYMDNCLLPGNINQGVPQSLHIDATLFSAYVENKFKDRLNIVDASIVDVVKTDDNIDYLVTKNGEKISGDFFIDASGFQSVLFKHMGSQWIDKQDWLPINRCIPNPLEWEFEKQVPYTTSESTEDGWILQVPLSNRWGSGYLYCSEFLSDDEAFSKFSKWSKQTYGKDLVNTSRVLDFKSGYWNKQWVGNCVAVGLSSGFAEPLEATNIHHTVMQIEKLININSLNPCDMDRKNYNRIMNDFYENVYLYLRFCYDTGRTDSEFWKYLTNNVPVEIKELNEKVKFDYLTDYDIHAGEGNIFTYQFFQRVAVGLKKCNRDSIESVLRKRNLYEASKDAHQWLENLKRQDFKNTISHKKYLERIINEKS